MSEGLSEVGLAGDSWVTLELRLEKQWVVCFWYHPGAGEQHSRCDRSKVFSWFHFWGTDGLVNGNADSGLSWSSFFPSGLQAVLSAASIHLPGLTCTYVSPAKMNVPWERELCLFSSSTLSTRAIKSLLLKMMRDPGYQSQGVQKRMVGVGRKYRKWSRWVNRQSSCSSSPFTSEAAMRLCY